MNIEVNVLMGANLAGEVADEKFCETTIGIILLLMFNFHTMEILFFSFLWIFCFLLFFLLRCVGCRSKEWGSILKNLIETDNFKVVVIDDVDTVEVCGALKVC